MPLYCFTNEDGGTIEEFFPMGEAPESIQKYKVEFRRDLAAEWRHGPGCRGRGEWPITCYASGVHASQAQELRDHFRDHGCSTEVTGDGDPIYRDHQHRKRALKCRDLHDNASFGT